MKHPPVFPVSNTASLLLIKTKTVATLSSSKEAENVVARVADSVIFVTHGLLDWAPQKKKGTYFLDL